jgi:CheY-like chemotaxis protein/anti-sigma regulatory factor (Ser/Thr protein kinase)
MKTILIADDDRTTRKSLRDVLTTAGFSVRTAVDGAAALKAVRAKAFDLLLTDIWMPRLNGLELMARLRREPVHPRVVVLTSDDTPDSVLRAVREQAYHYLRKPVEPEALVELVKDALAAKPLSPPIEVISARPDWVELLVPCELGCADRITKFIFELKSDLPENVREQLGKAFRKLLNNAIEWGGKFNPNQKVRISCLTTQRMVLYRIADPGTGFRFEGLKHAALENPPGQPFEHMGVRSDRNLRAGGFGILIVKSIADELLHNEAQNEVVLVKYLDDRSRP